MGVQDRYAGDIGDFGKFAFLRALAGRDPVGVCWYRTDGSREATKDGRYLQYVDHPERFRALDPTAFDTLAKFVEVFRRCPHRRRIADLEHLDLLPATTRYHSVLCPSGSAAKPARLTWASDMRAAMHGAKLVLLDPDNGFEGASPTHKSVLLSELVALRQRGRALLLYHHQTRRKGGATEEWRHIRSRVSSGGFRDVRAVRLRPYSSRFYFLLDGDDALRARLETFAATWKHESELYH